MKTNYRDGKKKIRAISKKGDAMGVCATLSSKYLCCNVHVLRSVHNCPFDCSYCFLQNYLSDGVTKTVEDINALMNEVKKKVSMVPDRLFRIGTWELGDSLALEGRTGQAKKLIEEFAQIDNAILELKTKSDRVDAILDAVHRGRTVISWSLNTDHVINSEEYGTASLDRRLEAIKKVQGAGYLLGLHFDPMIFYEGWEQEYRHLVRKLFQYVRPESIAWISIGSLRFNPEMKKKIENNHPKSMLTCAEMVLGDDNKMRYVKPLRMNMYRTLFNELNKFIQHNNLIYLCMERWDVWERVIGWHPQSINDLDFYFATSIYERFNLIGKPPVKEDYQSLSG